jgi:four helix bundle protein
MSFSFEKLDVYQRSLSFVERSEALCGKLKGQIAYPFLDQLTRAVLSVPLNIAEGNGRWHKNEKKRFFWIAKGSVYEAVPILQIFHRKGLISDVDYRDCYNDVEAIARMLTRLIASVDALKNEIKSV